MIICLLALALSVPASAAVIEADAAAFDALDANKDGSINVAEITAASAKAHKEMISGSERPDPAKKGVHPADLDENGTVSALEHLHARLAEAMPCDADGDGLVTRAEWLNHHAALDAAYAAEVLRAQAQMKAGKKP